MSLKIYNSLTNKLEEFVPKNKDVVNMYVCGPTVYNYIHAGNARPVVFFDTVKKYLEFKGYKVNYASNVTDVDDKIIAKAQDENKTEAEIAAFYEKAYFENCASLNAARPDFTPHATDYIEKMIDFISQLIDNGFAYEVDGDVYFRVNKLESYGALSNQAVEELENGVRIDVSDKKESPLDFTLWKKTDSGIKWDSPFGKGRPGWHTECVVMNSDVFGQEIDIHGGGSDLKFPHHENEIAQSEAIYHHPLSKYWMHVGRLMSGNAKMSKSLGNVKLINDYKTKEEFETLRLLIITQPYRSSINFTPELVEQYKKEYTKFLRAFKQASLTLDLALEDKDISSDYIVDDIAEFKHQMDNDFSTPNVLTLLQQIAKDINKNIRSKEYIELNKKLNTFVCILQILGIEFKYDKLNKEDRDLYNSWNTAKANKDYDSADLIRQELVKKGIL